MVFHAMDIRRHDASVAIKLLDGGHFDRLGEAVFHRETRALERLDHSNIVRVLDSSWSASAECYYIALEYLPRSVPVSWFKPVAGSTSCPCRRRSALRSPA